MHEELKSKLSQAGVNITSKRFKSLLDDARTQAQAETDERYPSASVDTRWARYIKNLLGILSVIFTSVFMVLGVLLILILFPYAEFQAVKAGIHVFDDNELLAGVTAFVIVLALPVVLFLKNVLRDNLGTENLPRITFKRTVGRLSYLLGLNDSFDDGITTRMEELYLASIISAFLLSMSILMFGFMGRASGELSNPVVNENVITFLANVFTGSASNFLGYWGTLVLTGALLSVMDGVVLFLYNVFIDVAGKVQIGGRDESLVARFLETRTYELQSEIMQDLLIKKQSQQKTDELPN